MTDRKLYSKAIQFLTSFDPISLEILSPHLVAEYNKPKDLASVYYLLCRSAQSQQSSPKVIGGSIGGLEKLGKILFGFDPHKVATNFQRNDHQNLLQLVIKKLKPTGKLRMNNQSLWPKYCKTLLDGAHFLSSFKTAEDFYSFADLFRQDHRALSALPLMISTEINGVGFSLACDFLKELGYTQYAKPDVHLKDILKGIGFLDPNEKSSQKSDLQTFKVIDRIAVANKTTPYAVDKVFWLIGSGDFYLLGIKIGSQKKHFIDFINSHN